MALSSLIFNFFFPTMFLNLYENLRVMQGVRFTIFIHQSCFGKLICLSAFDNWILKTNLALSIPICRYLTKQVFENVTQKCFCALKECSGNTHSNRKWKIMYNLFRKKIFFSKFFILYFYFLWIALPSLSHLLTLRVTSCMYYLELKNFYIVCRGKKNFSIKRLFLRTMVFIRKNKSAIWHLTCLNEYFD